MVRELANGPINATRNAYFYENYKAFKNKSEVVNQVVIPSKYRKRCMKLVHNIPFRGHMGNRKKT